MKTFHQPHRTASVDNQRDWVVPAGEHLDTHGLGQFRTGKQLLINCCRCMAKERQAFAYLHC
jgi:hypothetical protein